MVVVTIIVTFATLILTRLPLWVLVYSYEHTTKHASPSPPPKDVRRAAETERWGHVYHPQSCS